MWYSLVLEEVSLIAQQKNTRRSAGEGTVYKHNGKWEARFRIGTKSNGRPVHRCLRGDTKKEVIEQLQIERERYRGFEVTENSLMPLSEWLNIWLEDIKKIYIRESTYNGYKFIIDTYSYESLKPFIYNGSDDISLFLDNHYDELKNNFYFTNGAGGLKKYLNKYINIEK